MPTPKNRKVCTKIMSMLQWSESDWCAKTSPTKKNAWSIRKTIENLETNTESTNQNHWQKKLVKLVLQCKYDFVTVFFVLSATLLDYYMANRSLCTHNHESGHQFSFNGEQFEFHKYHTCRIDCYLYVV